MDPSFAAGGRSFGGEDTQNLLRSGGGSSTFTSPGPMQPGLSQLDILNMAAAANGGMADLNSYAYGGRRSQSAEVQRQAALAAVDSTFSPSWPPQVRHCSDATPASYCAHQTSHHRHRVLKAVITCYPICDLLRKLT